MAMFPVFIIGLIAGIGLAAVYFHYVKSVPSNTKFKLQEDTIENMREDMRTMELVNEDLRNQIEKLKAKINYVSASEQSITIAGSNNIDLIENGEIIPYTTILEKLNVISLNDVKQQAEQIFKNKNYLIGIISKNTLKIKPIKIK